MDKLWPFRSQGADAQRQFATPLVCSEGAYCSARVCALGLMRVNVTEARDENRQLDSDDHNQKINAPSVPKGSYIV